MSKPVIDCSCFTDIGKKYPIVQSACFCVVECLLEILCFNLGRPWRTMHISLQTDTLAVLIPNMLRQTMNTNNNKISVFKQIYDV